MKKEFELIPSSAERLKLALKHRERLIKIPSSAANINYFVKSSGKYDINIYLSVDNSQRIPYKLKGKKPPIRKIKLGYNRIDIGKLPEVICGGIPREVPKDYKSNLSETISYVNSYLGLHLTTDDIQLSTFSINSDLLYLKVLESSMRYRGELYVVIIRNE